MQEDAPLPGWFPEVADGEMVYFRRSPRKNTGEKWQNATVDTLHRSSDTPNLTVHVGRTEFRNVLHLNDPRLDDPNFMAVAAAPDSPGVEGIFIINPIRARHEAQLAAVNQRIDEEVAALKREIHGLKVTAGRNKKRAEEPVEV